MELAHSGDARLARLLVGVDAEGWILFSEALQGNTHLLLVGLRLRLNAELNHWIREGHRLEDDWVLRIAERVTGEGVLQADRSGDVAGAHFVDLFTMVRVESDQAANALLLPLRRVEDVGASLQDARVDAEEAELANEWVRRDLEGECRERRLILNWARELVGDVAWVRPLDARDVEWAWKIFNNRVKHWLDTLVLQR